MKLRVKKAKAGIIKGKPCIVFELNKYDFERAKALEDRDLDGYTLEVAKQKRSSDQNRYMWELIQQIADCAGVRPNDVYRHAIREAGKYIDVRVENVAYETFCRTWSDKGVGWWTEVIDGAFSGKTVRAYYGTSSYNSLEMSILIDWVIDEAHWYDIETETPEQIARRKAQWNDGEV